MNTFKLEVLTPRREFYSGDVEAVTIVLEDGEMTLLKDHEPMLAALEIGEMRIKTADGWKNAFASQGFVEVRPDETLIVGDRELEVQLARNAGVRSCFFANGDARCVTPPDYTVRELAAVIDIVRGSV